MPAAMSEPEILNSTLVSHDWILIVFLKLTLGCVGSVPSRNLYGYLAAGLELNIPASLIHTCQHPLSEPLGVWVCGWTLCLSVLNFGPLAFPKKPHVK